MPIEHPRVLVIDFETTGFTPPEAEIIEVGLSAVIGAEPSGSYASHLFACAGPIPPQTRAVHHIVASDLIGRPLCSPERLAQLVHADGPWDAFAAHNTGMEGQWLTEEVRRGVPLLCTYKAALRVWPEAPGHGNGCLRYWLEDEGLTHPCPETCQPAHRAGPDAYVTAHLLGALLKRATLEEMIAWTDEPAMLPTCPIGVWRGTKWADVDLSFIQWILSKPGMAPSIAASADREINRRRDEWRANRERERQAEAAALAASAPL
jgi:exodeoxyribonuclease X